MTINALRAGAHALVEKPLAGSVQEAREIVRASRLHKRFVAVGYQDLYAPQVWEIKQALVDGGMRRHPFDSRHRQSAAQRGLSPSERMGGPRILGRQARSRFHAVAGQGQWKRDYLSAAIAGAESESFRTVAPLAIC